MTLTNEGGFIPHEAWGEEDPEKHAMLEPKIFGLSDRTKKALRKGKGHLGKDIRGQVTDAEAQGALREAKAVENEIIGRIDQGEEREIDLPDDVDEMLRMFNFLPQEIREEILKQVTNAKTLEGRFEIIKEWISKIKAEAKKSEESVKREAATSSHSELETPSAVEETLPSRLQSITEPTETIEDEQTGLSVPDLTPEEWEKVKFLMEEYNRDRIESMYGDQEPALDKPAYSNPFKRGTSVLLRSARYGGYHHKKEQRHANRKGKIEKGGASIRDLGEALLSNL